MTFKTNTPFKMVSLILLGILLNVYSVHSDSSWWVKHASKFTCVRPGYFVNEADCHNFYRCVDRSTWNKPMLQRYDFTCPNGMVFDQSVSVCTHPGRNGCADPWWPQNDSGKMPNIPESSRPGPGNSLESLPPIFQSSKGPNGRRPAAGGSGGGNDPWFDRPSRPSSSSSESPFGGREPNPPTSSNRPSKGNEDPLDFEFGESLDLDLDSPGGSQDNKPSTPESSSAGNSNPFNNGGSRPANPFTPGKPGGPFGGGSDPLDIEFGSSQDAGSSAGENLERPIPSFGKPGDQDCDEVLGCDDEDLGNGDSSSQSSRPKPPSSWGSSERTTSQRPSNLGSRPAPNRPKPGNGAGFNKPVEEWDRNDNFPDSPSDSWGSNELDPNNGGNNNRPGNGNWGGPQRPVTTTTPAPNSFDNSPWRPTGPWGSGFNELNPPRPHPGSPSNNRPDSGDSWWDPPMALPLRPNNPGIDAPIALSPRPPDPRITAPPPPPPGVWANPYRPRYPVYQIVAYPTWPGPVDRRPIIVVYSNSRKK